MENKGTNNNEYKQVALNLFQVQNKPLELSYTGEQISSDGGLLMLKELENQTNIIKSFSSCIDGNRD